MEIIFLTPLAVTRLNIRWRRWVTTVRGN